MIIESKTLVRHVVLPIFYDVDLSHARKQIGSFAKTFVRHNEHFKDDKDKAEGWKAALRQITDLTGMVL